MNALNSMFTKEVSELIKSIDDPLCLAVVLSACVSQRCSIGGAKPGTCKDCQFLSHYCRELYNIAQEEIKNFRTPEGGEKQ